MTKRQFSIRSVLCLPLIVLSCVLLFADCVKAESVPDQEFVALTAEQAAEINTVDNLLKSYKTITCAQLDYIGGYTIRIHRMNRHMDVRMNLSRSLPDTSRNFESRTYHCHAERLNLTRY